MRLTYYQIVSLLVAGSRLSSAIAAHQHSADVTTQELAINITALLDLSTPSPVPTHIVQVHGLSHACFVPSHVSAVIGDVVRFDFRDGNVSIAQSSLQRPCDSSGSFDTGFVGSDGRTSRSVDLLVGTTSSQWFFCREAKPLSQCERGMTFVINPGSEGHMIAHTQPSAMTQSTASTEVTSWISNYTTHVTHRQGSTLSTSGSNDSNADYTYVGPSVRTCTWPTQYSTASTGVHRGSTATVSGCTFPQATNGSWNWPVAPNVSKVNAPFEGEMAPGLTKPPTVVATSLLLLLIANCVLDI